MFELTTIYKVYRKCTLKELIINKIKNKSIPNPTLEAYSSDKEFVRKYLKDKDKRMFCIKKCYYNLDNERSYEYLNMLHEHKGKEITRVIHKIHGNTIYCTEDSSKYFIRNGYRYID